MPSIEAPGDVARLVREHVVGEADAPLHGATFDGRRLVLAAGNRLLRLVPDSGRVVDQLETFPEPGGLAYDGRCLWQCSEGRVQRLDARTGSVVRAISLRLGELAGLECIGHDLLVLHAAGRAMSRVETFDATALVDVAASAPMRGLAWVGGQLWSSMAGWLCRVDAASARVAARVSIAQGIDVIDLAGDDAGRIWCVDGRSRVLRAFVTQEAR
ncbi:MAG TPA: hypothetical protein VE987_22885 [Polyangiaceae bacterium]|nr:hypothetical protein [Polyangiaceae bacterium]